MAGMVNNRLAEASYLGGDAPCPAALCIAPTRELASQIFIEAKKFSSGTYLRPIVCYGGVSVSYQLGKLERGCHILIGTPGRLLDFVGRNKVSRLYCTLLCGTMYGHHVYCCPTPGQFLTLLCW
jgi:probable ATP-dependent RNA helicase DDX4